MDNQNTTSQPYDPQLSLVDPAQKVAERLLQSHSVLVTVSTNPSVDQLAACIALTLILNKAGKHATAVFSGAVPSTIEFLQPEKTLEKNTDSLRDFIIALDKSKADRLRYKVEDKYVKIFITPYKTSISEKDLEFSQGDLNCDVIVALGVHHQQELDQAIMAHGRILHDATIISINTTTQQDNLGTMNWQDDSASSLSELITNLSTALSDKNLLDSQNATALLTGIVASTKRFSNERTAPKTMNASALLLAAGANQQLVAAKLEPQVTVPIQPQPQPAPAPIKPIAITPPPAPKPKPKEEEEQGVLDIMPETPKAAPVKPVEEERAEKFEEIRIDSTGTLYKLTDENGKPFTNKQSPKAGDKASSDPSATPPSDASSTITGASTSTPAPSGDSSTPTPASTTSVLSSAVSTYEPLSSEPDSMSLPPVSASTPSSLSSLSAPTPANNVVPSETLEQIEKDVESPHLSPTSSSVSSTDANIDVDAARSAVMAEAESSKPPDSMGSQPLGPDLHDSNGALFSPPPQVISPTNGAPTTSPTTLPSASGMTFPSSLVSPSTGPGAPPTSSVSSPTSPPPVPPPIFPSVSQ